MTGLPAANSPWPPPSEASRYDRMRVTSTWYSGNPDKLAALYANGFGGPEVVQQGVLQKVAVAVRRFFWGTSPQLGERVSKVHVPLPEDIATRSSELLFSEDLTITVDGDVYEEDVLDDTGAIIHRKGDTTESTKATQKRLEELLQKSNFRALLLAAAETQSPLGSTALRVAWDTEIEPSGPFITRADADAVITEYSWGRLVAVTFWRVLSAKGDTVVRHLERHERGKIFHGVYEGSFSNLGQPVPLAEHGLEDIEVNEESAIELDPEYRFAVSIPNMLPDPNDRQNAAGRSDLTPGVITLLDALDETATSLMRDIQLAKGRLIVADFMLEQQGAGKGASFNPETSIFSPLRMQPTEEGEPPITIVQFAIRVEEHIRTAEWLVNKALRAAGYNPDGDYSDSGQQMTATEYAGKNRRSLSTRDKKIAYWKPALEELLEALLVADRDQFNTPIEVFPVRVEFPDVIQPDLRGLAETVELFKRAEAASLQVRVETLHPDWDSVQVQEEIERIQEEHSVVNPDTFGLSPNPPNLTPLQAAGDDDEDEGDSPPPLFD